MSREKSAVTICLLIEYNPASGAESLSSETALRCCSGVRELLFQGMWDSVTLSTELRGEDGSQRRQELVECMMPLPLFLASPRFGAVVVPSQVMAAAVLPPFTVSLREQDAEEAGGASSPFAGSQTSHPGQS